MTAQANPPAAPAERARRKALEGRVVSDKMHKTAVVQSVRLVRHPKYGKYQRRYTRYYVHDEKGEARIGDLVEIASTRPLSRLKRWRLVRVVERSVSGEGFTAPEPSKVVTADVGEAPAGAPAAPAAKGSDAPAAKPARRSKSGEKAS